MISLVYNQAGVTGKCIIKATCTSTYVESNGIMSQRHTRKESTCH
jgi:hypothetical protein